MSAKERLFRVVDALEAAEAEIQSVLEDSPGDAQLIDEDGADVWPDTLERLAHIRWQLELMRSTMPVERVSA